MTIVGVVFSMADCAFFHKGQNWWLLILFGSMFLFLIPFFACMESYCDRKIALDIKKYLDTATDLTTFDKVLELIIYGKLDDVLNSYSFKCEYIATRSDDTPELLLHKRTEKDALRIELFKSELIYRIDDADIEEPEDEPDYDDTWVSIAYEDINPNCDVDTLLAYLSEIKL